MEEALEAVGLRPEETLGRYPHQLSGGQRQRIMVARALLLRPRLIIADEPVSMVDASLRATILDSLLTLNREFGISLIYITHDLTTAYQISEDIIVLYRGSVAEAGDVELVVPEPRAPLHPAAGRLDPAARSGQWPGRANGALGRAARGAVTDRRLVLPVPRALPARDADLRRGSAAPFQTDPAPRHRLLPLQQPRRTPSRRDFDVLEHPPVDTPSTPHHSLR